MNPTSRPGVSACGVHFGPYCPIGEGAPRVPGSTHSHEGTKSGRHRQETVAPRTPSLRQCRGRLAPKEDFDVVVVGARCTGATVATFLARRGLRVCVVDRSRFPSDTPSTHIVEIDGAAVLARLALLDKVWARGAPPLSGLDILVEDVALSCNWTPQEDDPEGGFCLRRRFLDSVLQEGARESGVDIRTSTRVVGLTSSAGRVTGVRVLDKGRREYEIRARLLLGADGRVSTVGRLVNARRYNVIKADRFICWTYYEGASEPTPGRIFFYRNGGSMLLGCPTDSDLYMIIACPRLAERQRFAENLSEAFDSEVQSCDHLRGIVRAARLVREPICMAGLDSFFRESAGPGWALVGDAGRFKNPCVGRGISDGLRQAEFLSTVVAETDLEPSALDRNLQKWWRWRDRYEAAWSAYQQRLAQEEAISPLELEVLRRISRQPHVRRKLADVFTHRLPPIRLVGPTLIGQSAAGILLRSSASVFRDASTLARAEVAGRLSIRKRKFEDHARGSSPSPPREDVLTTGHTGDHHRHADLVGARKSG